MQRLPKVQLLTGPICLILKKNKKGKPLFFPLEKEIFSVEAVISVPSGDLLSKWCQCEVCDLKILFTERNADDRQRQKKSDKKMLKCKLQPGEEEPEHIQKTGYSSSFIFDLLSERQE